VSIGYLGNVVDIWEKFDQEKFILTVTKLRFITWAGGYYPVGISFEEANVMMAAIIKQKSTRNYAAIQRL
jgi:urocanate hydratase